MIGGIFLAVIFSIAITKPLDELTKAAKAVGSGNLGYEISINSNDEIGQLASSFNKMSKDVEKRTNEIKKINSEMSILQEISIASGSTMDLKELLVSVTSCFNIFKPVSKSAIFIINGDRMILSNPKVYPESFVNAHKSDRKSVV